MLGLNFAQIVSEIHPSLGNTEGPKSVTNETIQQLVAAIQNLREVKLQRMQRVRTDVEINVVGYFLAFLLVFSCLIMVWSRSSKILQQRCWSSGT